MDMNKSIIYYQDTNGTSGFFRWDEFHQNRDLAPDVFTHALHYGGGLIEGIRIENGYLITVKEHLRRIADGADKLLSMRLDPEQMEENLKEVYRRNLKAGHIKLEDKVYGRPIAYSDKVINELGEREPGLGVYSKGNRKVLVMGLFPWGAYLEGNPRVIVHEDGVACSLRKFKTTGGYSFNGFAKNKAKGLEYDEALITDNDSKRNILEGTGENVGIVFATSEGMVIETPGLDQDILPGTKRAVAIEILRNFGVKVRECKTPINRALLHAAAMYFTGTATGIAILSEVYDPVTGFRKYFEEDVQLKPGLRLSDIVEEYGHLIRGEEVQPVNRDLQARIRTPIPL